MEPIILPRISDQKPLVSVVSITYNHEPYIRDCLEGFLLQKTDFPIEVIIHDDASTDHTAEILLEYYNKRPDLFYVIVEQKNIYSQGKSPLLETIKFAKGRYIAICEGDDFWIDPLKLQKQFDFMAAHPQYSMCGTRVKLLYEEKKKWIQRKSRKRGEITLNQVMRSNPYATCTTFVCADVIRKWMVVSSTFDRRRWMMGDLPMFIFCATKGNGCILGDVTGVYRILNNSATHGDSIKMKKLVDGGVHIRLKLIKELGIPYSSERILKQWSYGRVKLILKKKLFVPKRRLMFFWRFYWQGHVHYKPIRFVILFVLARIFRVVPVEKE